MLKWVKMLLFTLIAFKEKLIPVFIKNYMSVSCLLLRFLGFGYLCVNYLCKCGLPFCSFLFWVIMVYIVKVYIILALVGFLYICMILLDLQIGLNWLKPVLKWVYFPGDWEGGGGEGGHCELQCLNSLSGILFHFTVHPWHQSVP